MTSLCFQFFFLKYSPSLSGDEAARGVLVVDNMVGLPFSGLFRCCFTGSPPHAGAEEVAIRSREPHAYGCGAGAGAEHKLESLVSSSPLRASAPWYSGGDPSREDFEGSGALGTSETLKCRKRVCARGDAAGV